MHDGAIVFGGDDGHVYSVDAATGRQRWMQATGGPVSSTPAIAGGRVYALSYDGRLYALDERSGEVLWKFATEGERRFEARGLHGMQPRSQTFPDVFDVYLSSPMVADGAVFFGSGDGHLYAVDADTGDLRWRFRTGDVVHASPAFADGVVYAGSWDGRFYAVDARSGQQRWQVATDASWVNASPAVSDGRVYFGTSDSSLYRVVDAAGGQPLQQHDVRAYMFASPTVAGDVVLLGMLNGVLQARDKASGSVLWEFQTEASRANRGWVLTADHRFNAPMLFVSGWHEATDVAQDRQASVGSFFSTPLVANGVVYVGSADGNLYAIE